jgi:O-antigen/teichoic acid export membrane protein
MPSTSPLDTMAPLDDRPPEASGPSGIIDPSVTIDPSETGASPIHRVMRGALMLLSTQPITWASSLLMTIFIPRLLDSRSFGEYTVAVTLSGLLGAVVSLGVPTVLTRRIAAHPETARTDCTTALTLLVGLGIVVMVVGLAVVPATGLLEISTPLLVLAFVGMVVVQGQNVLNAALVGLQWMGRYAWSNALLSVCITVVSLIILVLGGGAFGFALAAVVPLLVVVAGVWVWFGLGLDWSGTNRQSLLRFATMGLPFLAWGVLVRFRSEGEMLFLGSMLSVETVGWWNVAMRIVVIPLFVPTLIVTPLMPALSQIVDDHAAFAATLRRSFELTVVVAVGASAAIFAFAPVVPSVLGWAPEYQAAVPLMQVLVLFFPLASISMVFGTGLMALGDERRLLLANVAATALQYILLVPAVPLATAWIGNGALGAACTRVASELVMLAAVQVLLPRGMVTLGTWLFAGRVLVASAVMVAVSTLLLSVAWPLAALAGGLAYLGTLFVVRAARPSDVRLMIAWASATLRRRRGAV